MRSYTDLTSRKAVFAAMAECDARGREAFLARYGFHEAQSYVLRHEGRLYDSKPILAVAYGYQHGEAPLRADEFSGGRSAAAGRLMRLGFDIDGLSLPITDWTLAEVEPTVAIYFDMLAEQLAVGEVDPAPYLKRMKAQVSTRPESAHGRKFSNINAVLQEMDVPFVAGIGRSPNAQILLRAVVTDWLDDRPEFVSPEPSQPARDLIEEDPPAVPPKDVKAGEPRPRKTDYAARDAANRALGEAGEELALRYLQDELRAVGQDKLAGEVRWVSKEQGDGLGYDIASFSPEGDPVFVEVKTTCGGKATPFFVSANEVRASLVLDDSYLLMRIYDFSQAPKFYRMKGVRWSDPATCERPTFAQRLAADERAERGLDSRIASVRTPLSLRRGRGGKIWISNENETYFGSSRCNLSLRLAGGCERSKRAGRRGRLC